MSDTPLAQSADTERMTNFDKLWNSGIEHVRLTRGEFGFIEARLLLIIERSAAPNDVIHDAREALNVLRQAEPIAHNDGSEGA